MCGRRGPVPCGRCVAELHPPVPARAPDGVDACLALVAYEGAGRQLVTQFKYRNHRAALSPLARGLATLVGEGGTAAIDVVTWVPTSRSRRRVRGFDQAELLARRTARVLGRPCRATLVRGDGPAQTGLDRVARQRAPAFAGRGRLTGTVLLVDDVVTTGATVRAASFALRAAGAEHVVVVAVARTPPRSTRLFRSAQDDHGE